MGVKRRGQKFRKNLLAPVKRKEKISCENFPPWYTQLLKMDESKRKKAVEMALSHVKEAKPDAYEFIKNYNCKLIGFIPNVMYSMPDDSEDSLSATFVHDFSKYTLLYWCEEGQFALFINSTIAFNKDGLRGLIG